MSLVARLRKVTPSKLYHRVVPGWQHLGLSRIRRCRCCQQVAFIEIRDPLGEWQRCHRCGANFRYELLADAIRQQVPDLARRRVLELDYRSPLKPILSQAKEYIPSFFDPDVPRGTVRPGGERCEDVTALTFPDQSLDLVVSSEVLEHVPDVEAAAREVSRVLRPGGYHLFTVPVLDSGMTVQRARLENGKVVHLVPPEYHGDSTTGGGILAFWTYGRDLPKIMDKFGLKTSVCLEERTPNGELKKIVWLSKQPSS